MKKMIEKTEKKDKKDKKEVSLEINIIPLLLYLLKKLWIFVLVGIITASITFVAVKILIDPTYRNGFTAYVNNKQATSSANTDYLSSSDVNAAKELVKTYSAILKSNSIMKSAREFLKETHNLDYTEAQLKSKVSTQIQDETEIIQVYVVAKSPDEAYKIAEAISKVAPDKMAYIVEGSSMKIVEEPEPNNSIYKPNYFRYSMIGFLVGFLLTAVVFIIHYLRNDTIMDESEIESRFSVPVLGVIPDTNSSMSRKSGYYYNYYYKEKTDDTDKDKNESKGDRQGEKA